MSELTPWMHSAGVQTAASDELTATAAVEVVAAETRAVDVLESARTRMNS